MARLFLFCVGIIFFTSCAIQEQAADKANIPIADSTTNITVITIAPGSLTSTLNAYYKVKDAFTRTDGTGADMTAMQLRLSIDSLDVQKLAADSSFTPAINSYKKAMTAAVDEIIKERDMQKKRMQFASLSDNLYKLAKAIPYKGETIYRVHCPMAFDKGANWLSNQPVVTNPYFGSKMMECGEVTDSLMGK